MTDYRTEENLSVITTNKLNIVVVSLLISFISTSLYFFIFIFSHLPIDLRTIIIGIVIFFVFFISILFIRTEYFLAVKNDYKIRPPLQILLISVVSYIILLFITPDKFMGGHKLSIPIMTLLIVPSAIIGMVAQKMLYHIFIILIKFISKITSKDILGESVFRENVEFKFQELLRHGGIFSIILISFTIPRYAVSKIRRSLIFTLFFDILRKNIRKTDLLGILENGKTAGILSNGNDLKKASAQAHRLIDILEDNQLLIKKLNVYNSVIKSSVIQANKEYEDFETLLEKAISELSIALEDEKIQIKTG